MRKGSADDDAARSAATERRRALTLPVDALPCQRASRPLSSNPPPVRQHRRRSVPFSFPPVGHTGQDWLEHVQPYSTLRRRKTVAPEGSRGPRTQDLPLRGSRRHRAGVARPSHRLFSAPTGTRAGIVFPLWDCDGSGVVGALPAVRARAPALSAATPVNGADCHDRGCGPAGASIRRPGGGPGLLAILVRWRVEVLLLCALASAWNALGTRVIVIVVSIMLLVAAVYLPVRRAVLLAWHLLAVPHRVRSAFVQAGVASRQGYLPWLFVASPAGIAAVSVYVGMPAGQLLFGTSAKRSRSS